MKISYFSTETSLFNINNELYMAHPSILLADKYFLSSGASALMIMYLDVDIIPMDVFFKWGDTYFSNYPDRLELVHDLKGKYPEIKKLNKEKHKNKEAIRLEGMFKSMITRLRKDAKYIVEHRLKQLQLFELMPFEQEKVLKIAFTGDGSHRNEEDNHIQAIKEIITGSGELLLFDPTVKDLFSFTAFDSIDNAGCDFIKIPLWDFPLFRDINFAQMKYTRNELQPALVPFKTNLAELSAMINGMEFSPKNLAQIKHFCTEKLSRHIAPVQSVINDSLYISERRNKFEKEYNFKFCLGISSAETLISYFEKTATLLPYVCSEIKQQVGRYIDLKTCRVFVTYDISLFDKESPAVSSDKNVKL